MLRIAGIAAPPTVRIFLDRPPRRPYHTIHRRQRGPMHVFWILAEEPGLLVLVALNNVLVLAGELNA